MNKDKASAFIICATDNFADSIHSLSDDYKMQQREDDQASGIRISEKVEVIYDVVPTQHKFLPHAPRWLHSQK